LLNDASRAVRFHPRRPHSFSNFGGAFARPRVVATSAVKPDRHGELSRAGKLVERFVTHRNMILRFTVDLAVPFTNNQAERDIRPVKLQQKISPTWRTLQGLADFAVLRSYLSTAAKHGKDALAVLRAAGESGLNSEWLAVVAGPGA
jgi:hypothetical protein